MAGRGESPAGPIDCGNSGTSARLLMGAVAGMPGVSATFTGDASLSARPMKRVAAPLQRMGAIIDGGDRLPISIEGARLGGIEHRNVPASAQVKSAILLAGLGTSAPVSIVEPWPSRDHTEIMFAKFGCPVAVDDTPDGWVISLGGHRDLAGCKLAIGADPSAAAFPLVAAAITPGSDVMVPGMLVNPLRTGLYETLEAMGADIELSNERIQSGEIVADVRARQIVARTLSRSRRADPGHDRRNSGAGRCLRFRRWRKCHRRTWGTDGSRKATGSEPSSPASPPAALPRSATETVCVYFGNGKVRGGASVLTQGDHRIAMAFLTLGLAAEQPVEVDEAEMIGTSFPSFVEVMRSMGADIG